MILEVKNLRLGRGENEHEHWRSRAARVKREKGMVFYAWHFAKARKEIPAMAPPYKVTLTRIAPSDGLDTDNLVACCKSVRDQVAICLGLKRTDRAGRERACDGPYDPITFECKQEYGEEWGVRIEVRNGA